MIKCFKLYNNIAYRIFNHINQHIVYAFISIFIVLFFVTFYKFMNKHFTGFTPEEILFFIQTPWTGVDGNMLLKFIKNCIISPFFISLVLCNLRKILIRIHVKSAHYQRVVKNLNFLLFVLAIFFIVKGLITNKDFKNFFDLFNEGYSTFYEENYVSASKIKVDDKKNLILIIVESLEQSYSDSSVYGKNLIPNLSELEGIRFSNFEDGYATNYTAGMMIATFTGLPPYLSLRDLNYYGYLLSPYSKLVSLGNLLGSNEYQTIYILGSKAEFAGTKKFLSEHGIDSMIDREYIGTKYPNLKIAGKWGYGDTDVFSVARLKLSEEKKTKPFFMMISTIDSHGGYVPAVPVNKYKDKYENIIYNTDLSTANFINWIKKQDFYKNTVIVVVGDHFRMGSDIKYPSQRKIFNLFINTKKAIMNVNRTFSQVDLFPTILEAMGINLKDHSLGVGVSVFSDKKTLLERYDSNTLFDMMKKKSKLLKELWYGSEIQAD